MGIEIGKWLSPNKYEMEGDGPVPVDIPRVRYEVLKRRIRSGNDAPVADGGPDLIGVEAGSVTLGRFGFIRSRRRRNHIRLGSDWRRSDQPCWLGYGTSILHS